MWGSRTVLGKVLILLHTVPSFSPGKEWTSSERVSRPSTFRTGAWVVPWRVPSCTPEKRTWRWVCVPSSSRRGVSPCRTRPILLCVVPSRTASRVFGGRRTRPRRKPPAAPEVSTHRVRVGRSLLLPATSGRPPTTVARPGARRPRPTVVTCGMVYLAYLPTDGGSPGDPWVCNSGRPTGRNPPGPERTVSPLPVTYGVTPYPFSRQPPYPQVGGTRSPGGVHCVRFSEPDVTDVVGGLDGGGDRRTTAATVTTTDGSDGATSTGFPSGSGSRVPPLSRNIAAPVPHGPRHAT